MLFILFGPTAEMGKWSREYLQERELDLIRKKYHVPEGVILKDRFGVRRKVSEDEVRKCDFVYENNGILIGFDKSQILDAVRGRRQCLITASANTVDFIKQIKSAYGDYAVVIGTYTGCMWNFLMRAMKIMFL